ncbi:YCII domain-containing protein [Sulfidibacter corallicola]|uniref:YCII-related domain-containing protein n=1 Tax=Sulfidibacter corallicola TaxID=2818388 RepID=A0A8A4TXW2_SULCO|nr:YciI family protein [Sulfidibacter corallicola]QTD54323.1 hypothetical protein J3U87_17905 [Sulfidibacter corallicola]
MAQYMLILHDAPTAMEGLSPEEIQSVIAKYSAWRDSLASSGILVDGNKLKDDGGKKLSNENGRISITDGPFSEAKEVIGGYFIVNAPNYDAAIEITKACPHLDYGRVELREVDLVC